MSKKYQENIKHSQKTNREEMVRRLDCGGAHPLEMRNAASRFQTRVIQVPDNQQQGNCYMSSSISQPGELGLNGNLDSPDLDTPSPQPSFVPNSNLSSIYHGDWPIDRIFWNSAPSTFGEKDSLSGLVAQETASLMSWSSTASCGNQSHARRLSSAQPLGTKVEMVYSLLSMLGAHDKEDMSKTLLAMSQSPESCMAMRQSGCLPLLVQLLHGTGEPNGASVEEAQALRAKGRQARLRASQSLHNIVHAQADDKRGRRETRVLRLLEQIREYSDHLRDLEGLPTDPESSQVSEGGEMHAGPAMAALMKLSFDEDHRNAMCQLGGLHAIAELIEVDQAIHSNTSDQFCVTLRRYAGMALTNLTFGDGNNKALLCSLKGFMFALVAQLHSPNEDLRQVMASVLRNLSWRADSCSKQELREVGAVNALMGAAMHALKESTLKSVLSALWNLSAHCSANKADICSIHGSLAFLVNTLNHPSPAIIENGGGILRNISSHIAVHEEYRTILRRHSCLQILLHHLKSSSLTVVSNACGTLWNLSARCAEDQRMLWDLGAVAMLRNLVHSKHKMISMGSSAALKNLLSANPTGRHGNMALSQRAFGGNCNMPSLVARKQKALEEELDQNLAETCDNIDSPKTSPTHRTGLDNRFFPSSNGNFPPYYSYLPGRMYHSINGQTANSQYVSRSESRESVGSTHSEPIHPHHRTIYHSFSKNSRYVSVDRRYYDYGDFNRSDNSRKNGDLLESTNHDRLENSVSNERFMIASERERRVDFLHKEAQKNQALSVQQEFEEEPVSPTSIISNPVPAHNTGIHRQKKDKKDFTKNVQGTRLDAAGIQEQPIDYSYKFGEENPMSKKNKKLKEYDVEIQDMCTAKNEQNIQENSFSLDQGLRHPWQHLNSASFHPFTSKQTKLAMRKTGQECTIQHINSIYGSGSYTETDLDDPADQVTDFSQKFKEHMDTAEDLESSRFIPDESKQTSFQDETKVYCTEGTPLNFSSSSSLTDLRETQFTDKKEETARKDSVKAEANESFLVKKTSAGEITESSAGSVKSVTFGEEVNYSLETPLMFSRCSSLGSLSGFEQQTIQDDRSSVVSDFSHRTSEVVSPSDLPDSPSQTMPSSPHQTNHSSSRFSFSPNNCRSRDHVMLKDRQTEQRSEVSVTGAANLSSATAEGEDGSQLPPSVFEKNEVLYLDCFGDEEDGDREQRSPFLRENTSSLDRKQGENPAENANETFDSDTDEEDLTAATISSDMPRNSNHSRNNIILHTRINDLGSPSNLKAANSSLVRIANPINKSKNSVIQSSAAVACDFKSSHTKLVNHDHTAEGSEKGYDMEDTPDGSPLHQSQHQYDSKSMSASNDNEDTLHNFKQGSAALAKSKIPTPYNLYSLSHSADAATLNIEHYSPKSKVPTTVRKLQSKSEYTPSTPAKLPSKPVVPKKPVHSSHNCGFAHGWPKSPKEQSNLSVRPKPFDSIKNRIAATDAASPSQQFSTPSDIPQTFTLEGTPVLYSDRHFQEESRGMEAQPNIGHDHPKDLTVDSYPDQFPEEKHCPSDKSASMVRNHPTSLVASGSSGFSQDLVKSFQLEGTPLAFSCNSSLSSLSVESMDDLSAGEQALLEECINSGKPKPKSRRSQSKYSKGVRKASGKGGIPVYCGPWVGNQNASSTHSRKCSHSSHLCVESRIPVEHAGHSSNDDHEEKWKEDERARENLRKGESVSSWSGSEDFSKENSAAGTPLSVLPPTQECAQVLDSEDLEEDNDDEMLLVVTISPKDDHTPPEVVLLPHEPMSESLELLEEAQKLALKVEAEAEDLTQSSISCLSDIENAKPPSLMGDLLTLSMTSSNGISEYDKGATWRKGKDGRKVVVPETVRRALAGNLDVMKSSCNSDTLENMGPPSCMGSIENLSMRSSLTFELLENINPPSAMDQIPRTGSCTSLNSISSDILESKSQSLADTSPNLKTSGGSSEMYERLNAAAAMVQVYSRELSAIMNGGNGNGNRSSSSTSENIIDHIQPPTIFMDIAEVSIQDGVNVITDNMASDTEMDEELPRDDETEGMSSDTLRAPYLLSLAKDEHIDGSTENVSTLVEDEPVYSPRRKLCVSKLEITAEEFQTLQDDANLLVSTLNEMGKIDERTSSPTSIDKLLEDETLSLISNESDGETSDGEPSSPATNRGPRIVKPVTRKAVQQMKGKGIKGGTANPMKGKEIFLPSQLGTPKTKEPANLIYSSAPRPVQKKTPPIAGTPTSPKYNEVKAKTTPSPVNKTPSPKFNSNTFTRSKDKGVASTTPCSSTNPPLPTVDTDDKRPKLIKQGTFTKDSPTHSPAKTPVSTPADEPLKMPASNTKPKSDRRMSYGGSSSSTVQNLVSHMKRNLSGANLKKEVVGNGMRNSASSRSLTRQDEGVSRGSFGGSTKRSPSTSSLGSRSGSGLTGSNVSLSSNSSTGTLRKGAKKEVSSKIAVIWKKGVVKKNRPSPERSKSIPAPAKAGGAPTGKSKIVKPITPAGVRSKLSALGCNHASS